MNREIVFDMRTGNPDSSCQDGCREALRRRGTTQNIFGIAIYPKCEDVMFCVGSFCIVNILLSLFSQCGEGKVPFPFPE